MEEEKKLGKKPMEEGRLENTTLKAVQDKTLNNLTRRIKDFHPSSSIVEPFLFRVPSQQCDVNPKAYEPEMISIGPYHRGKQHLVQMEKHKTFYLAGLLAREGVRKANPLKTYIEEFAKIEKHIRDCYAEAIDMRSEEFVEMMVLDACFIVELIRRSKSPTLREGSKDVLFRQSISLTRVKLDLILLENQIPFIVVDNLFRITCGDGEDQDGFAEMVLDFFPWRDAMVRR